MVYVTERCSSQSLKHSLHGSISKVLRYDTKDCAVRVHLNEILVFSYSFTRNSVGYMS